MAKKVWLKHVGTFSFTSIAVSCTKLCKVYCAIKILGSVTSGSDFLAMSDRNPVQGLRLVSRAETPTSWQIPGILSVSLGSRHLPEDSEG